MESRGGLMANVAVSELKPALLAELVLSQYSTPDADTEDDVRKWHEFAELFGIKENEEVEA